MLQAALISQSEQRTNSAHTGGRRWRPKGWCRCRAPVNRVVSRFVEGRRLGVIGTTPNSSPQRKSYVWVGGGVMCERGRAYVIGVLVPTVLWATTCNRHLLHLFFFLLLSLPDNGTRVWLHCVVEGQSVLLLHSNTIIGIKKILVPFFFLVCDTWQSRRRWQWPPFIFTSWA